MLQIQSIKSDNNKSPIDIPHKNQSNSLNIIAGGKGVGRFAE